MAKPNKIFKQLSSTVKFINPYWEYRFDRYSLPENKIGDYHFINSRGASMIIPITDDRRFLMTSQFRYLNQKNSIEFPGGGVKVGNTYLQTAIEELSEETGAQSTDIIEIGEYNPFNGVTNEITKIFFAKNLTFKKSNPEVTEQIDIRLYTLSELEQLIASNNIWDGMTLAAWSIFKYSKYYGEVL